MRLRTSELFQTGRVKNLDRRDALGQRFERTYEIARGWHLEMSRQRRTVGPVLDEHQPQRVFAIGLHGVQETARFKTRAMHVLQAQFAHLVDRVVPRRYA